MRTKKTPQIIILAGPNGAGKSTTAPLLLRDTFAVDEFVNADTIAYGLSAFAPEKAALEAGKIMLRRLSELSTKRTNFAFETTLASRSFAPWLTQLIKSGYSTHLMFLTLPDVELAITRVAKRVRLGGHSIEEAVIRRRFTAGLRNLFELYMPVVTSWKLYDNSRPSAPHVIASRYGNTVRVQSKSAYENLKREFAHEQ